MQPIYLISGWNMYSILTCPRNGTSALAFRDGVGPANPTPSRKAHLWFFYAASALFMYWQSEMPMTPT